MKTRDMLFSFDRRVLAFILCGSLCGCIYTRPPQPNVPTIAGQQVPAQQVSLNFSNRFDFHCNGGGVEKVFQNCKLIGFTGQTVIHENGFSSGGNFFQDWIVLEAPDGRRIYLTPREIEYLEDAAIHQK